MAWRFGLAKLVPSRFRPGMSTVAEIESALEKLPSGELLAVAAWLDDQRVMIQTSEQLFSRLDAEEGDRVGQQWLGE